MNKIKIKRMIAGALLSVVLITAGVYKLSSSSKVNITSNTEVSAKTTTKQQNMIHYFKKIK